MTKNFFAPQATIDVTLPVSWEDGRPVVVVLESAKQYAELLPTIKEVVTFETFSFLLWTFGQESWIREASMALDKNDGTRYLDGAKFRENKIRYLLNRWTLVNESGDVEPLDHTTFDGRRCLTDTSLQKVLKLDSVLVFLFLGTADRVLGGAVSPAALFTKQDFLELVEGKLPVRFQEKLSEPPPNIVPKV